MGNHSCCKTNLVFQDYELDIDQKVFIENEFRADDFEQKETSNDALNSARGFSSISGYLDLLMNDTNRLCLLKKRGNPSHLRIRVLNSTSLEVGTVMNLSATGFSASPIQRNDGITFFGGKRKELDRMVNDFVVPCVGETGRMFMIYYEPNRDKYFLRDLGKGPGVFIKVVSHIVLKENELINIGESYILVSFDRTEKGSVMNKISIKVFGGEYTGEEKQYLAGHCHFNGILIGRHPSCEIVVDDKLLSKVQCSILYTNSEWVLIDGNVESRSKSTNGSWVYTGRSFELIDNLEFKFGQNLFKAAIIKQ